MKLATQARAFGKKITLISAAFVLAVSSISAAVPFMLAQQASAAGTQIVYPTTPGWVTADTRTDGYVSFVADSHAPIGAGALSLRTGSNQGQDKAQYINTSSVNVGLGELSALGYSTKTTHSTRNASIQLYVDLDNSGTVDTTLVYETYYNGTNVLNTWQSWDALGGKFWPTVNFGSFTGAGGGGYTTNFTLSDVLASYSAAKIKGFGLSIGSYNPDTTSLIDAFNFDGTTYDFEPTPPDTQRPDVSFITPSAEGQAFKGNLNVEFQASDNDLLNGVTVNIKDQFNVGHLGTCGSVSGLNVASHTLNCTINTTTFADGTYFLRAGATDVSGNNKTVSREVVFDNTRPTNKITYPLANSTQSSNFVITGVATDATSGVDYAHVWVTKYNNDGSFGGYVVSQDVPVDASGNYQLAVTLPHNEGPYGYRVHSAAYDKAGNVQNTEQRPVFVDTEAPNVSLASPGDGAVVKGASLTQTWSSTSTDVEKYIYKSFNDAAATSLRWEEEFAAGVTSKTATNVANATFWWQVTAVDAHGNETTSPLWKLTVDNTAPTVAITNPVGSLFNTDVEVRGTATDANLRHYWVKVERNGSAVYDQVVLSSGITNELLYTATEEGTYVVTLAARDTAGGGADTGNRSADVVKTFTIDKSVAKPINLAWLGTGGVSAVNGYTNIQNGVLSWKAADPSDVDHYVYKFWTNIPGYQDDASNPWFDSFTHVVKTSDGGYVPTGFSNKQGTYFFCVETVDAAGNNSGCSDVFQVTFDNTAPVAVLNSLPSFLVNGTITITGSVSDNIGLSHYNLSLYNGTVDLSDGETHASDRIATTGWITTGQTNVSGLTADVSRTLDTTGLADGVYQIRLAVRDLAQNRGAESVDYYSITVDNTPVTVTANTFVIANNVITPNVTTSETPASQLWTQKTGPVGGVTISDPTALMPSFTVLQDGAYEFELAVLDAAGNPSTGVFSFSYTTPVQTFTNNTGNPSDTDGDGDDDGTTGGFLGPVFTPADSDQLGASDESDESGVDGASTEKNLAQALNNTDGNAFGLAWYWWLLIVAGGAAGIWWLIAALRGRSAE